MLWQDHSVAPSGSLAPFAPPVGAYSAAERGARIPPTDGAWRIVRGWAGQLSVAGGGRPHLFSFFLPGDLVPGPSAHYDMVALTHVDLAEQTGRDDEARAAAEAASARLFAHAARLATYGAYGRIADLLLELHDRCVAAGLASGCRFPFPVGQEQIGAITGLSAVHVNRTLAKLRADRLLLVGPGWYALPDRETLRRRMQEGLGAPCERTAAPLS